VLTKIGQELRTKIFLLFDELIVILLRKYQKVSEAATGDIDYSLILIEPTTLTLIVGPESQYMAGPRRRIRASFTFNNIRYNFVVTDPWVEAKYFAGNDGRYEINESRICISLPEIFNGTSTKLVATVITPERCTEK